MLCVCFANEEWSYLILFINQHDSTDQIAVQNWNFWHAGQLEINAVMSAVIPGQNTKVCAGMSVLFTPRCEACKVSRQSWHMIARMTIQLPFTNSPIYDSQLLPVSKISMCRLCTFISGTWPAIKYISHYQTEG